MPDTAKYILLILFKSESHLSLKVSIDLLYELSKLAESKVPVCNTILICLPMLAAAKAAAANLMSFVDDKRGEEIRLRALDGKSYGVSRQTEMPKTQKMLATVRARVLEGYSLARSLEIYPKAFPDLFRATVAAGESSGHLDAVLNQLADFSEAQYESAMRVQQALVYPVILFVLPLLILAGLLGYLVPDIVTVFADTGQALPALTQAVIAASDFVAGYGWLVGLGLIGLGLSVRQLLLIEKNRLQYDRFLLKAPLVAKMSRGRNIAQFASTLSILTASGVPLVEAMKISGEVVSNTWLRTEVVRATLRVSEGSSLQAALQTSGYFPPMMLYMIASGEASGELDGMLARVARYLQQDVESLLATLLSLIGPLMLVIMGGAVFTIVMAILLPIINLNQLVG